MPNRLLMPGFAQTDVRRPDGTRTRYTGGIVTPRDSRDERALRDHGAVTASPGGTGPVRGGYRCAGCGFGSWFVHCGRCGGTCTREA